MIQREPRL